MNATNEVICEPRTFKRRIRVFSSTRRIDVRFIAIEPFQLRIKHAMKISSLIQSKAIVPSLFQVASRIEDFAPAVVSKSTPPLEQTPFVELMLHPEKLEAALKIAKVENDAFDAARTFSRQGAQSFRHGQRRGERDLT